MARKPTKVLKARAPPRASRENARAGSARADSRTHAATFPIVGIGASAGGLEAFKQILQALPVDTGLAYVMIQHMGPSQPSMLTKILARETRMPVVEADQSLRMEPNHVYVITPGMDLTLSNHRLIVARRTSPGPTHQAIDTFFESLAHAQGHQSIGVILSGSASDGTVGLEAIKAAGGITFAQDASAAYEGMPSSAIESGCVDFVLPPDAIAREIARIARHPYVAPLATDEEAVPPEFNFAPILDVLRQHTGVDFTHYKRTTLYRRITRRMVLHKLASIADYVQFLKDRSTEVDALYQDVLINVTGFFRDPATFELLKSEVFPRLGQGAQEGVRFWVVGCATGEEAYSLAIAFSEYLDTRAQRVPLQVFATDLNPRCIDKARLGLYGKAIAQHVSPERLTRYFVEADGGYRIRKSIRDMCVFARHNVLTEPPFSRIDLIACRNVLIYLGRELQQRTVRTLHYALRPEGFLMLGGSETIGSERDLFDLEHVRQKIYRRKPHPMAPASVLPLPGVRHAVTGGGEARYRSLPVTTMTTDAQKEAERILLARYAPPGVLLNANFDILQFRGHTGHYLAPAPGRATLNALKMLREGLLLSVRAALQKAKRDGVAVRHENLQVKSNGGYRDVTVEVHPVRGAPGTEVLFLVLFEDARAAAEHEKGRKRGPAPRVRQASREQGNERLKQELEASREYLESVIEQQEATNEELQAANEEVQSSNEELQSVNEELETSKEEIQATNEELSTVNEELRRHNADLNEANDDLVNLLGSVDMAIVMIDSGLRIRRFTPPAQKMLNLIGADIGRSIKDLSLSVVLPDFERHLRAVLETATTSGFEVLDHNGRLHAVRLHPYRTQEDKVEGVVLVFIDIETPRRSEALQKLQSEVLDQVQAPMVVWESSGNIVYWNQAAEKVYGYSSAEVVQRNLQELLASSELSVAELDRVLQAEGKWRGKMVYTASDGRKVTSDSRMVLVPQGSGRNIVIEAQQILQ